MNNLDSNDANLDEKAVAYAVNIGQPDCLGDISFGAMTFWRNKNPNALAPTLHEDDKEGPWLRLAVAKDAYTKATAGTPESCDRCELRDNKVRLGTPVAYTFDIRAEQGFPLVDARCVCVQIKAPYYDADGGSPLFALRIDRGRYIATVEHLYEKTDVEFVDGSEVSRHVIPYDAIGGCADAVRALDHHVFGNSIADFKELQVRALLATDEDGLPKHLENEFRWCTNLAVVEHINPLPRDIFAWSRFTVRVAPTRIKDQDGVLELSVSHPPDAEEQLVVRARGEFGHAGYDDPKINTGPTPGQGLQYFKIGPYRDKLKIWGDGTAAVHVRNIRRSYWEYGAELRDKAAARW